MERKQNNSTSQVAFELVAIPAGPDPEDERFFIYHESQHVEKAIKACRKRGWVSSLVASADGPSLDELKHYHHRLKSYANTIDRYEAAMDQGVLPFRVAVTNVGHLKDHHINITVTISEGTILLARQLPSRPERPAGHQHVTEMPSYSLSGFVGGFMRSNIRIGRRKLSAQFSELGAGEEAALVNQSLFLEMTPDTSMAYELSSEHLPDVRGYVTI